MSAFKLHTASPETRPIGWFVHHQGRGHVERTLDLLHALPQRRPVCVFTADAAAFGSDLPPQVTIEEIPSLFEATGQETEMDHIPQPQTVHCAPLGWPGIREAMGRMAAWMREADPALIVTDVSAEVAQLARLLSVPHVVVLQHGTRGDQGHRAALDGAAGVLAPFHATLAQPDWAQDWLARTHFAPGLGVRSQMPTREAARSRLSIASDEEFFVVVSGGGGSGLRSAPLGVGARAFPHTRWTVIGHVGDDWHATTHANLEFAGWVDNAPDYIAAADLVIASTGNTTCAQILTAGRPWIAIPEWRYFDEQVEKARAMARAGLAHHLPHLPSSAHAWRAAVAAAYDAHRLERQRDYIDPAAAALAARWLDRLATELWSGGPDTMPPPTAPSSESMITPAKDHPTASVLTLARGRDQHLHNVVLGLKRQSEPPLELVIGVMQEERYDLPETSFPIRQILIEGGERLPLARARNTVAAAATGEVLVFVDVDCIPAPTLVADYARAAQSGDGVMMGEVMYLPDGVAVPGWTYARFEATAEQHADRQGPPESGRERCSDYRCFWSLNFAIHRDDWTRGGGFDEGYVGYGGEDTDFGRTLDERGVPIHWIRGARVYHQYHPHAMPPIHHLDSVLVNANRFAEKWGHRTMEHWLYAFQEMGLIRDGEHGLEVIRRPDAADEALCNQQSHMPYASTTRVLRILEERKHGEPLSDQEALARTRSKQKVLLHAAQQGVRVDRASSHIPRDRSVTT